MAAAAQGDSRWLQLLLSPVWRGFWGGKHCPPLTPSSWDVDSSPSSNLSLLQFSFALKTWAQAEAAPRDAATRAESKEVGTGSHLIATARMTESWGLILAPFFSKGEQGSEPLHLGIFQPPISIKVVFPPASDSSRCHQSPPCSEGGRMQWEAGRHPAPSWVPALRAGPGARSQNPAVGIWCVYL